MSKYKRLERKVNRLIESGHDIDSPEVMEAMHEAALAWCEMKEGKKG